ncbi:MAG: metal ABC transporter ATP-binding protein [Actinobacteria bacterium]|nr:metal ABC transporter ATP-binding protein [Actinomycetota bacterium]
MTALVEARDLTLSRGGRRVLGSASFTIEGRPAVTAVIGPNGSGKSTLLHALAGLISPDQGSIKVLGESPGRSGRVSYVLQSSAPPTNITPITVRETVRMGRYPAVGRWRRFSAEDRAVVEDALARMQLTDLADRHLHELSGGQRQRVFVAQGLAQPHDVLLLDEPLTGLDLVSARTIDDLIHERTEVATILTTHDLDEARLADSVILIGAGTVISAGPPAQVCTRAHLETAFGLGALHDWHGFLDEHHHD